jgi:hypothetical protein
MTPLMIDNCFQLTCWPIRTCVGIALRTGTVAGKRGGVFSAFLQFSCVIGPVNKSAFISASLDKYAESLEYG